ncbi:MAG: hypothetical protein RDU89_02700 [bacterium]|nr:hypothetical protein [bacterium]
MTRSTIGIAILVLLTALMVADVSAHGLRVIDGFMLGFKARLDHPDRRSAEHLRDGVLTAGPGLSVLEVNTGTASIQIIGADTGEIRVNYRVRVLASDPAQAVLHAKTIMVALTADGDRGRLTVTEPPTRPSPVGGVEVDLLVQVPRGLALEVDAAYELTIRGAGSTRAHNFGPTVIEDLQGDLVATVTVGSLRVNGVSGSATVEAQGGHVVLINVGGAVQVDARVASRAEIRDVGGGLSGHFLGGSLEVSGVRGEVGIQSRLTHISLRDVGGPADIGSTYGGVTFFGPVEDVCIRGAGSHIRILLRPEAGYRVQASVSHGFFSSDFPLEVTREDSTDHAEGTIGDGAKILDVINSMGSVEIRSLVGN